MSSQHNLIELSRPMEFPACGGCSVRQQQITTAVEGLDGLPEEVDIEANTTCLPLLRLKAIMEIRIKAYESATEEGTSKNRKKPFKTKKWRGEVNCPGQANGVNVQ